VWFLPFEARFSSPGCLRELDLAWRMGPRSPTIPLPSSRRKIALLADRKFFNPIPRQVFYFETGSFYFRCNAVTPLPPPFRSEKFPTYELGEQSPPPLVPLFFSSSRTQRNEDFLTFPKPSKPRGRSIFCVGRLAERPLGKGAHLYRSWLPLSF